MFFRPSECVLADYAALAAKTDKNISPEEMSPQHAGPLGGIIEPTLSIPRLFVYTPLPLFPSGTASTLDSTVQSETSETHAPTLISVTVTETKMVYPSIITMKPELGDRGAQGKSASESSSSESHYSYTTMATPDDILKAKAAMDRASLGVKLSWGWSRRVFLVFWVVSVVGVVMLW